MTCNDFTWYTLNTVVCMLCSFSLEGVLLCFHSNQSFCLSLSHRCGLIFRQVAAVSSSSSFFFCPICYSSGNSLSDTQPLFKCSSILSSICSPNFQSFDFLRSCTAYMTTLSCNLFLLVKHKSGVMLLLFAHG